MIAGGVLIYVLAAALCSVYTIDTVIVAYNYRFFDENPPSSKLLFLAEALKLLTASSLFLLERRRSRGRAGQAQGPGLRPQAPRDLVDEPDLKHQPTDNWWLGLPKRRQCCLTPHAVPVGRGWWLAATAWAQGMLVFAVPAVCYFITNNLSFYALKIMSAHTYTLLSDLKVITTCALSYLLLDRHLNRQAVTSLVLLFTGICIGQYATSTAEESSAAAGGASQLQGVLIMVLVAVLSAVAAVYTEWIMNYSSTYGQESLNLQNMRLYASGTLLNALHCMLHAKTSLSTFDDMRASHWVNVAGLAFMGLVTSLIIKRYGNVVKVYASCVASLFSAGISYSLLHDPPAPLFYVGCILAMVATLQLQRARAALAAGKPLEGSSSGSKALWAVVGITVVALVVAQGASRDAAGLPAGGSPALQGASSSSSGAAGPALRRPTAAPPARDRQHVMRQAPGPVTDAPMMALPPFEPTCIATELSRMASWGCPVMRCSQDPSCTVSNTSCCAHLNYEMLSAFDALMSSKCMDGEYFIMFGSAIGALRDETILPHTEDIDLGLTPLALQFLELNSSRAELWQHGYALWHHAEQGMGWWKMCPHQHHPSPAFQAAMVQEPVEITAKMKLTMPIYADFWPMWPVDERVQDCRKRTRLNLTSILATPWDDEPQSVLGSGKIDPCKLQQPQRQMQGQAAAARAERTWCIHSARKPFSTVSGERTAHIGSRWFPTAADQDGFLSAVYGKDWHTPDRSKKRNHGAWIKTPDAYSMVQALVEKLSVGAWGGMPYKERQQRCKHERGL